MEQILVFIDTALVEGRLTSVHPPPGDLMLQAFVNMLIATQALIGAGHYSGVSEQLVNILGRCDGQATPPDFVEGEALSELGELIQALIIAVDTEESPNGEGSKWAALRMARRV